MIISFRRSTNQCLSLVTSHINLVQLWQEAHESCFSRRPRKGSPVCESHLLHWEEGKEGRGQPASGGHCERRWGCCWAERSSLPVNRPAPEPPYQFTIWEHNRTKQNGRRQTGQTFPLLNAETFQTHLRRSDEPDVNKSFTNQAILAKILFFFTFFIKDPHSLTRIPFIHSEKDPSPPHISNKKQLLVLENNQRTDKKVSAICKIIWIFPVLSENISCTLWKVGCLFRSFNSGKCCWSKVGINKSHANLSRLLAKTIIKTEKGEKSGTQGLLSWKRDKVGPTG